MAALMSLILFPARKCSSWFFKCGWLDEFAILMVSPTRKGELREFEKCSADYRCRVNYFDGIIKFFKRTFLILLVILKAYFLIEDASRNGSLI
jgi:hypothetical protein